jgi:hypothetical protein
MTTTTLILPWADVQADDVALYDHGLVYVTENRVLPQEGHPEFLIAYVSGLHVDDDGTVTDAGTGMSPNAAALTAVRRPVKPGGWDDPHPGVSPATLTAALRGCWVTVHPEDGSRAASGHMAHPDRVAAACLDWIGTDDVGALRDAPEIPGHDTEPPAELPAMDIGHLTEIIARALTSRKVAVSGLVRPEDGVGVAVGTLRDAEHLVGAGLRAAAYEAAVEARIRREMGRLDYLGRARILASLTRASRLQRELAETETTEAN